MSKRILVILFFIILFAGTFLRLKNLSQFKVYPDSYESLLVSENIGHFHSVVGVLGNNGLVFPEYFMWTRPVYPLLINVFNIFVHNPTFTAQLISFVAGILAIPVSFYLVFVMLNLFQHLLIVNEKIPKLVRDDSNKIMIPLAGAFLLSISFYHSVWGGFIMTETTGVLFMLLFLLSLFFGLSKKSIFLDILTGILFAIAVFTRYEYAIIAFPAIFLLFKLSNNLITQLVTIGAASLLTSVIFITQLFPIHSVISVAIGQSQDFVKIVGLLIAGCILLVILRYVQKNNSFFNVILNLFQDLQIGKQKIPGQARNDKIIRTAQALISFGLILYGIFTIPFLRSFLMHEPLISFSAVVGFVYMFVKKEFKILATFSFISCALLIIVYQKINPQMDRYMTHILPFLLIPASFGLTQLFFRGKKYIQNKQYVLGVVFLSLISYLLFQQCMITHQGLRYLHDPSWYQTSYEETSAELVKKSLSNCPVIASEAKQSLPSHSRPDRESIQMDSRLRGNDENRIAASSTTPRNDEGCILLVSRPEPYFYFLQLPTQSIADVYPYVYFKAPNNPNIVIVSDMGMSDIFPNFSNFLKTHMPKNSIIASYSVGKPYHTANIIKKETSPVVVYKVTYVDLMRRIDQAK